MDILCCIGECLKNVCFEFCCILDGATVDFKIKTKIVNVNKFGDSQKQIFFTFSMNLGNWWSCWIPLSLFNSTKMISKVAKMFTYQIYILFSFKNHLKSFMQDYFCSIFQVKLEFVYKNFRNVLKISIQWSKHTQSKTQNFNHWKSN